MATCPPRQSRLLSLPLELQLQIYSLVLLSAEPLPLTCFWCRDWYGQQRAFLCYQSQWDAGAVKPPAQPALTQTCRAIRAETLRIFYGGNTFLAAYARVIDVRLATAWLRAIGARNRGALTRLFFVPESPTQDCRHPDDLRRLKRGALFRRPMAGSLTTVCLGRRVWWHQVTFVAKLEDARDEQGRDARDGEATYEGLALLFDAADY